MRLRYVRSFLVLALLCNVIIWHRIWRLFVAQQEDAGASTTTGAIIDVERRQQGGLATRLSRMITVVLRQFEAFENDFALTVESIRNALPQVAILVVCDELPYPPLQFNHTKSKSPSKSSTSNSANLKVVELQLGFNRSLEHRNPLFYVRTKYVAFVPDSTRFNNKQLIQEVITSSVKSQSAIAIAVGRSQLACYNLSLKFKQWSLGYQQQISGNECDLVTGRHVTFVEAKVLRKLSDPFLLPFPDTFYLQTKAIGYKVQIMKERRFNEGRPLYRSQQAQSRLRNLQQTRERSMFRKMGIKKVTRGDAVEWYGCSRDTARCFGPVVNGVPSYIYQDRYTPPCCLAGLRKVANHVFDELEEAGIRYWLEGGTLLGAMKFGDLLPWGHSVDIGVNRDDLGRSSLLQRAKSRPCVDDHGYVWEKATEGEFFRVQYSRTNRLHANILPFYLKNGTMTKDDWFTDNKDFPVHFLHPMTTIDFAGRRVPSPNNIRDFLEIKYYKGVIESSESRVFNFH